MQRHLMLLIADVEVELHLMQRTEEQCRLDVPGHEHLIKRAVQIHANKIADGWAISVMALLSFLCTVAHKASKGMLDTCTLLKIGS